MAKSVVIRVKLEFEGEVTDPQKVALSVSEAIMNSINTGGSMAHSDDNAHTKTVTSQLVAMDGYAYKGKIYKDNVNE